jgi:hypothetical protein
MRLLGVFHNPPLIAAMIAWSLAQFIKPFLEYAETKKWNWGLFFSSGGMPSSHSALVIAPTLSIGLHFGFDNPLFALGVALSMIVVYDAAGVRRQAGIHAQRINLLINELFAGHPIDEEQLKEVQGHTPREVIVGITLGLVTAIVVWLLW